MNRPLPSVKRVRWDNGNGFSKNIRQPPGIPIAWLAHTSYERRNDSKASSTYASLDNLLPALRVYQEMHRTANDRNDVVPFGNTGREHSRWLN